MAPAMCRPRSLLAVLLLLAMHVTGLTLIKKSGKQQEATEISPVDKVLELIKDLIKDVETEGKAEATSYAEFACFCKDTTKDKSDSILSGQDNIDSLSAEIESDTAEKSEKKETLESRNEEKTDLEKDIEKATSECAKEENIYDSRSTELESGLTGTRKAIKVLGETQASSLIELRRKVKLSLDEAVQKTSVLSSSMQLVEAGWPSAISSLVQASSRVDPSDPEYKSHTGGIIGMLEKIESFLQDRKSDLDAEWTKTKATCDSTKVELSDKLSLAKEAIDKLTLGIGDLKTKIAKDRGDLISAESGLKDDKTYLDDLTKMCAERANDWDQRSAMRADELAALNKVLGILDTEVKKADKEANERALLQQGISRNSSQSKTSAVANSAVMSFLQMGQQSAQESHASVVEVSQLQLRDRALEVIRKAGLELDSRVLSTFAVRARDDPFKKVKDLIQKLIERLLKESLAETNKKGFCDKELAEARQERTFRFSQVQKLDAQISGLETKQDELEIEIEDLGKAIKNLEFALAEAEKTRKQEKTDNMATIKEAKAGLDAITQCIIVLKGFYSQASGAAMLIQRASPVADDTQGPGFSGSYQGSQAKSAGVIGMMEVIQTDFERTIRKTQRAEEDALRTFVKFERASKADISAKTMKKELDTEDLAKTVNSIKRKMGDMEESMELLDGALKALEELQPMCVDTGMSYSERKEKREDEIEALKKALCELDPDETETECKR